MNRFIKFCATMLVLAASLLVAGEALGQDVTSLKEHTDVLVAIVVALVTLINGWVTYSQITMRRQLNQVHDITVQLATSHNIHHPEERIDVRG